MAAVVFPGLLWSPCCHTLGCLASGQRALLTLSSTCPPLRCMQTLLCSLERPFATQPVEGAMERLPLLNLAVLGRLGPYTLCGLATTPPWDVQYLSGSPIQSSYEVCVGCACLCDVVQAWCITQQRCGSQGVACRDMRCFVCFASHTSHGGVWGGFGCQAILGCLHSAACDAAKPSWLGLSSTLVLLAGTRLFPSQRYILFCMSVVRLSQRQKHQ